MLMLLLSCRCSYEFVTAVVVFAAVVSFAVFVVVVAIRFIHGRCHFPRTARPVRIVALVHHCT